MVTLGERNLERGDVGPDVAALWMRLAGFGGTVPDGNFCRGTERKIIAFQRDWMKLGPPTGGADQTTFDALASFAAAFPIYFEALACKCGLCGGFGSGKFKEICIPVDLKAGKNNQYEYPGIHRLILWALGAAMFYCSRDGVKLSITSGYRCPEDNKQHDRASTDHHGNAVDFDVAGITDKRRDMVDCDLIRKLLVEPANAQVDWAGANLKSLEPSEIAPAWVHYDIRSYSGQYLDDKYFVRTVQQPSADLSAGA